MLNKIILALVAVLSTVQAGSSAESAGPFVNETWYSGLIDMEN